MVVGVLQSLLATQEKLNAAVTAAILHEDEEPKVAEEVKLIFYAEAELAVRYLPLEMKIFR
jgi:hypothetical protein